MSVTWWTVDGLAKVFPDSRQPGRAGTRIDLAAARGEREDAQVAIFVPSGEKVSKASFSFTDLRGPRGQRISRQAIQAFWQWYTFVRANPRGNQDPATVLRPAPSYFPDAFLEQPEYVLRGGATHPLWVRVAVPIDAAPGQYRGKLRIHLDRAAVQSERIDVPISLEVWPLTIPAEPSLHHTEWVFPSTLARYYNLQLWSEPHWAWIKKIAADMTAHRQDMVLTSFQELVVITQKRGRSLSFDFSRLDRWLDIFQAAGVRWIEGGHFAARVGDWTSPFGWTRFGVQDEHGKPIDTSRDAMSEREFERYIEGLLKAVHRHLKQRGLADRYVQHVADEPLVENRKSWCKLADKVGRWLPGVRRIDAIMGEGFERYCELRVPQIQEIHGPSAAKPPHELWSYVCLAPQGIYPNRFLDYPSIRNRILFWLSWSLGLKGFLHWGYAHWRTWGEVPGELPVSPWTDATSASLYPGDDQPLPAGDPHIVYPGQKSICSSIRWEVVRKGMEDYELIKLLETAVRRPTRSDPAARKRGRELLQQIKTVIAPDPAKHTHDADLLLATRRQIGELASRLRPN